MTATTLPKTLAASIAPRPFRWTCAEFHRFGDLGMFEGRRPMLIDGVMYEQGPMNPPHAIALGLVEGSVWLAFGAGWWLRNQSPLVLGRSTDPEPDLAVVPGSPRDYTDHPKSAVLVIEVADTSLDFDLDEKRLLYAKAGIREYWVVDVNGRRLHVHRDPNDGDYPAPQVLSATQSVTPLAATSAVRVADLLA